MTASACDCESAHGEYWYRTREGFEHALRRHGTQTEAAVTHNVAPQTLSLWRERVGLPKGKSGTPSTRPIDPEDSWLLDIITARKDRATVDEIADLADVSPRRVREAATRLVAKGFRLNLDEHHVTLERVAPARSDKLHPSLFDGEHIRVGIVSDTHLGANEQALEELELAYDMFVSEGVSQVWHAGDWGTGVGMFRTHHAESQVHTLDQQVQYLVENYPSRPGIVTRGISGNHDIEGDAGRVGFDIAAAFAAERDDIDYLGVYDAWIETRPDTGRYIHLLHGAGGMSYSWSYKAQKLVDGYPSARKPGLLIVGHWHVRGSVRARDVEVLWPGCFEWQSPFLKRLGLQASVGFHILDMTVGDDGTIVRFRPEWFPFYPGRVVD